MTESPDWADSHAVWRARRALALYEHERGLGNNQEARDRLGEALVAITEAIAAIHGPERTAS